MKRAPLAKRYPSNWNTTRMTFITPIGNRHSEKMRKAIDSESMLSSPRAPNSIATAWGAIKMAKVNKMITEQTILKIRRTIIRRPVTSSSPVRKPPMETIDVSTPLKAIITKSNISMHTLQMNMLLLPNL